MPTTQPRGGQVLDGSISRDDLNVGTVGQAVVRKIIQGSDIALSSTGADAGTGDVTVRFAPTVTNDDAAAGELGEYITANLAVASATPLTTATVKTIISISLTAGDWDVRGVVGFIPAGTTNVTRYQVGIHTVTNTMPAVDAGQINSFTQAASVPGTAGCNFPVGPCRFSLASTTTIYLVAFSAFTVSTLTAFGRLSARRVR